MSVRGRDRGLCATETPPPLCVLASSVRSQLGGTAVPRPARWPFLLLTPRPLDPQSKVARCRFFGPHVWSDRVDGLVAMLSWLMF